MRKLSEYKNEEALDLLADLIDPAVEIIGDKELKKYKGKPKLMAAKHILKYHKKSVLEIVAILNGVEVKDLDLTPVKLLNELLDMLNDEELVDFFNLQGQEMRQSKSSGSATENTEETEQK